eukprot:CAMPEP_0195585802 /NCGR_PEP_ID=MMETSP0814-20130614/28175_1 /TAXON_ID=97485 /ORGANISM="Prymnesium parvum, Strain Texoma1" /LENGTH=119 /DNA_ID=CAMNT_0040724177 /DNA_START=163 /DNA_END=523 /DNA_ORIENTATION=-
MALCSTKKYPNEARVSVEDIKRFIDSVRGEQGCRISRAELLKPKTHPSGVSVQAPHGSRMSWLTKGATNEANLHALIPLLKGAAEHSLNLHGTLVMYQRHRREGWRPIDDMAVSDQLGS